MGYMAKSKSREDIRNTSRLIRKIQSAEKELYFPIVDFLEKTLPRIIPGFTFRVGEVKEMGECHGLTFPERNEIMIRSDVYLRACEGSGRDRLTMAHELYHYLEHSKETVVFARTGTKNIPPYKDPEWQADAFGGELLVPYDLAKDLTIDEIAEYCGVSLAAAKVQYKQIHK